MNNEEIEDRLNAMQEEIDSLKVANNITYDVQAAFTGRGFIKSIGTAKILDAVDFSPSLSQTINISLNVTSYGDSTTQFDITNMTGVTFRYTYDGTGTNPNINALTLPAGTTLVVNGQHFNPGNNGTFSIINSGNNFFEVVNPSGVVESNKTLGTGALTNTGQTITVPQFASAYLQVDGGIANGFWVPLLIPPRRF